MITILLASSRHRIMEYSRKIYSPVSIAALLRQLSEWCENRWGAHPVEESDEIRPFDLPWLVLDHSAASETWNWQPQTSSEDILEEIAQHAEANPEWLDLSAQ